MMSTAPILIILAIGLVWLVLRPRTPRVPPDLLNPDVDINELQEAERELEDLDAFASPEDAKDHLKDWGPGAPGR